MLLCVMMTSACACSKNFEAEDFWKIDVQHHVPSTGRDQPALKTSFTWDRNRLFDEDTAELLVDICKEKNEATVTSVRGRASSKYRPIGMTTTSMQMIASRKFRFAPAHSLQLAESLYTKGQYSAPRLHLST